jgi:hypothetical protein
MKPMSSRLFEICGLLLLLAQLSAAQCSPDSVRSGNTCIDRYEASIWEINPRCTSLIALVRQGKAKLSDLQACGAVQHGVSGFDYGTGCPETGNGCKNFFAVSLPKLTPSQFLNWFQAAAACRNSWKRLPTNGEWQVAALGTPDPGIDNGTTQCNTGTTGLVSLTGSRKLCKSDVGAFDMVGNVVEFVGDWGHASSCGNWSSWSPSYGDDNSCMGADGTAGPTSLLPAATLRGGGFAPSSAGSGTGAGVFAIDQNGIVASLGGNTGGAGLRCAREAQ